MDNIKLKGIPVMNQRQELLIPYLNLTDRRLLVKIVWNEISTDKEIQLPIIPSEATAGFSTHSDDGIIRIADFKLDLIKEILPEFLIADIFSIYYRDMSKLIFEDINFTNRDRFNLMTGIYDSSIKIVTVNSIFYSTLYVLAICKAIVHTLTSSHDIFQISDFIQQMYGSQLYFEDFKIESKSNRGEPGENKDLSMKPEYLLFSESGTFKYELTNSILKTNKYVELLSHAETTIKKSETELRFDVLKLIPVFIQHRQLLAHIELNQGNMANMVNQVIGICDGFIQSIKFNQVNILEADRIDEFSNLEFLHPSLNNCLIDYTWVNTYTSKSRYKLNFYIDVSGSMGNSVILEQPKPNYYRFSALDYAKAVLLKCTDNGMIATLFPFRSTVFKRVENPSDIDILLLCSEGTTNLNEAIIHHKIEATIPGIIITDARCIIKEYNSSVLIVGVPGADFIFTGEGEKFRNSEQAWVFNNRGELVRWEKGKEVLVEP
jgi:hypothetical protein